MIEEKEIDAIVERVKSEFQDEAMAARKTQELEKITEQIKQIEEDDKLKKEEKDMHMSFLLFNQIKTDLIYSDVEKAKKFEEIEREFNKTNDVSVIRINPQGDAVVELRVPRAKIDNFDALLKTSEEYWNDLKSELEKVING